MPLPSLSSLLSYLPTVSLPPLIPLPSNLQQRLVSFLLRKALGGIVKGGIDSDRIEADLRDGTFAINRVEIDQHAIDPLLESAPTLSFVSGTVDSISAKVSYPLAQLSLCVSGVEIVLRVKDAAEAEDWLKQSTDTINPASQSVGGAANGRASSTDADRLQESMISIAVAQDFLEHELSPSEDAELRASLHLSPSTSQSEFFLPGAFGGPPQQPTGDVPGDQEAEQVEKTMLAGLIERILARLSVRVSQVRVRLVWTEDPEDTRADEGEDDENALELEIEQVEYLGDASSADAPTPQMQAPSLRAVKISPPRVLLKLAPRKTPEPAPSDSSTSDASSPASSTAGDETAQSVSLSDSLASLPPRSQQLDAASQESESESESESSDDENDLLALSQSIADLRTSTASLAEMRSAGREPSRARGGLDSITESDGSEMFESATSFVSARSASAFDAARPSTASTANLHDEQDPFSNPDSPPPAPTINPSSKPRAVPTLIAALGSKANPEPFVFYLSTKAAPSTQTAASPKPPPSLHLESTISSGWVVAATTKQLEALIRLGRRILPIDHVPEAEPVPPTRPAPPFPLSVSILLKSITLLFAHAPASQLEEPNETETFAPLWSAKDPSNVPATALRCPQLRFQLDEISVACQNGRWSISVRDFTLSEVLREGRGEKNGWKTLPILVSDAGLTREGSRELGGDWTVDGTGLTKDWRIKSPAFGIGAASRRKSHLVEEEERDRKKPDAVAFSLERDGRVDIRLSPLRFFVDLTILSRLSPVIDALTSAFSDNREGASTPTLHDHRSWPSSSSRPVTPAPPSFSQTNILVDLTTLSPRHSSDGDRRSAPSARISFALVRIDVRCPAPKRLRGDHQSDNSIRSGLAVVELDSLSVATRDQGITGNVKEVRFGLRTLGAGSKHHNLVNISALSPTDPASVLPSISFRPASDDDSPPTIRASLPLIHLKIDKRTLDTLQLFADDISQFFNAELSGSASFGGSSSDSYREKLIGSRFFGTKSFRGSARLGKGSGGQGRDSEHDDESPSDRERGSVKMVVGLNVTDLVVDLLVPSAGTAVPAATTNHIRLLASDVGLSLTSLERASDDLRARLEIGDLQVERMSNAGAEEKLLVLARTCPRDLTSATIRPLLKLAFATSSDPQTDLKESKVELGLDGFTYFFEPRQLELANDLANFVKAPEGAFEHVVPNELTRLRLRLSNLSLHLTPPTLNSRLVISLDDASIKIDLIPDLPRTTALVEMTGAKLLAVESTSDLREPGSDGAAVRTSLFWKSKGFVQLADVEKTSITVRQGNGLVLPDFELLVSNARVGLSLCADSVSAVTAFVDDLMNDPAFKSERKTAVPPAQGPHDNRSRAERSTADLFASVDNAAFEQAQYIQDVPEFLGDDVPANQDYLASTLSQRTKKAARTSRRSDASMHDRHGRVTENVAGETVRMFTSKGLQIHNDWLAESRCTNIDYSAPASQTRLRLSNIDLSIRLHEGYDWASTRRAIEEESKAVRRRLEKIRQLLADGQTPDATAEHASVLMFGSHQLGLPPGANEMTPKDLLAAIDEELDQEERDEIASTAASSWQTFPAGGSRTNPAPARKPKAAVVGKGRKRLTRSKTFAIEINVRGVDASFDSYSSTALPSKSSATSQPGSKVKVDVGSFEILDNIKTSTWRKFLTEMRPSDGGLVRASGSPMAKLEINTMRPVARVDSAQEEINMKIKIAPLRLYIDQDALDFFKVFGAFKAPAATLASANPASSSSSQEPFFQRVEVLPVKIKLDYKPKRVDYYALKQGKTAELMNFFHFDGSEMVLRHLVVTGVSGTTTLSNLVQDIWTPDVKANQLADVVSGIAPVRSVVNVGSGVANLVLLPIEQYRKDGRVVRGLQKGAQAFAKQTTLEAINVGAKLANGTQVILEQAEHVLGATFPNRMTGETLGTSTSSGSATSGDNLLDVDELSDEDITKARSRYAEQPVDLRHGVESAYKSLGENFKEAAQTILAVPMEVYERSGNEGPVRAVVRAVPIAVLRPMIGASGAVSKALLGLRNTLDPDQQQGELEDKYKPRPS